MRYGTVTDATGPDVITRAIATFGSSGHGLRLVERGMLRARLENPLGHVSIEVQRIAGRTDVTIETREFDQEVVAFIDSLPRYTSAGRLFRRWFRRG